MEETETDDGELKLQRDSSKLLDELKASIPLYLYKTVELHGPVKIRRLVKRSNTARLESLVNAFLESPQLLDPALKFILEPLVSCFKEYVRNHYNQYTKWIANAESTAEPLPRALCRLLYTLCKVRGAKVIINFFSNEPSMLEPMLDAFEKWNSSKDIAGSNSTPVSDKLTWEEKFIMLLWLSHLARTPFDLAFISSPASDRDFHSLLPFKIPIGLPDVACRLFVLGLRYIQLNMKEQEAAKLLLIRLCTRPDMIRCGLCANFVYWTLRSLYLPFQGDQHDSIHTTIGCLSFLAGFLSTSDNITGGQFIPQVLEFTQEVISGSHSRAGIINGSSVARKSIIKIHRSCATHLLSGNCAPEGNEDESSAALNMIVDHLITSVGDKDSTVRFAASKALSMIAQKLDLDMKLQVIDDIIVQLQQDIIYKRIGIDERDPQRTTVDPANLKPDISNVNPLQSQGLILTLSHLLFRHSLPQTCLEKVIGNLVSGLDFEQRSPMGVSVGSSVRDAACFGVWALARNYKTLDLLQVSSSTIRPRWTSTKYASVFEILAAELVVTATLDPEGNVRRAASAALQELIGRHPDMVPDGIALVQIVDYHAVALRSRAMSAVALEAAKLRDLYLFAVLDGLLSWRAVSSPDVVVRRQAATALGQIFDIPGCAPMAQVYPHFQISNGRSLSEWHGLYLALAAAIEHSVASILHITSIIQTMYPFGDGASRDYVFYFLREDGPLSSDDIIRAGKDAWIPAEALCIVICVLGKHSRSCIDAQATTHLIDEKMNYHKKILESAMEHCVGVPLRVYQETAFTIFDQLPSFKQKNLLHEWMIEIKDRHRIRLNPRTATSWIAATGAILHFGKAKSPAVFADLTDFILEVLVSQLKEGSDWQAKTATLKYLYPAFYKYCSPSENDTQVMHNLLMSCLDDYSIINSRDVGSQIRSQAIEVLNFLGQSWSYDLGHVIFAKVCGLATERTDKVRDGAWNFIKSIEDTRFVMQDRETLLTMTSRAKPLSTSDTAYFEYLIAPGHHPSIQKATTSGIITSASSGSESLICASRTAISNTIETSSSQDADRFYTTLLSTIEDAMPDGRLLRPGLEVLAFLLDVDMELRLWDSFSGWRKLVRSLPEILGKCTDIRILEAIVKIYAGLVRYDSLRKQALDALRKLLAHRYPKIRLAATAALYIIQPDDRLKSLDLGGSVVTVRGYVKEIYG